MLGLMASLEKSWGAGVSGEVGSPREAQPGSLGRCAGCAETDFVPAMSDTGGDSTHRWTARPALLNHG